MKPLTFKIPYKGFVFSGAFSFSFEDEVHPEIVTIEKLYIDGNSRDALGIIDPAIVHLLEDALSLL